MSKEYKIKGMKKIKETVVGTYKKIDPLIESKKEEIDSICEKGSRLL